MTTQPLLDDVSCEGGVHSPGSGAELCELMSRHLGACGLEIPAGSFVMTGGVTEAIAVAAGDHVAVRFQDLGTVSMRFV